MPLNVANLQQALLQLFTNASKTRENSAKVMAQAYADYASTAIFGPSLPLFTGLEQKLLQTTIFAILEPHLMNPAGLGTAFSNGIQVFWTAPPIVCVGAAPGTVTAVPGAASLLGSITAICAIPGQPAAVAAAGIAAAIHVATQTTIATLTVAGVPTPTPIA